MFGGSGLGGDSKSGDNDDLYDYSIDLRVILQQLLKLFTKFREIS